MEFGDAYNPATLEIATGGAQVGVSLTTHWSLTSKTSKGVRERGDRHRCLFIALYWCWLFYLFQALTQTLEMRENFQKQLQEIMSATCIVKTPAQRTCLSRSSCNSASSTPDSTRSARSGRSRVLEALRFVLVGYGFRGRKLLSVTWIGGLGYTICCCKFFK